MALVFNTLLSASPKELAGDVGAWRGLVHNMSGSVGIAVAGALAVGLLSALIQGSLVDHPVITPDLQAQINLDDVDFLTNEQVENALSQTTATPEQITEAVRINGDAAPRFARRSSSWRARVARHHPGGRMRTSPATYRSATRRRREIQTGRPRRASSRWTGRCDRRRNRTKDGADMEIR